MKLLPELSAKGIGYSALRVVVLVYVAFCVLLYVRQDSYIFIPPNNRMEGCDELADAEIIFMEGTRAYFLHVASSTKLAVSYHGNGESACDSAFLVRWLASQGYSVLGVEYAGYSGDSTHSPTVALLLDDVRHVDAWVKTQNPTELLIVGRSVGTGFASYHSSLSAPDKLLLISPFDTLAKVAKGHFPVYPAQLILKTDLDNVAHATSAKRVLVIHGTEDVVIPFARGKALFEALPQKDKTFFSAEGFAHNDLLDFLEVWGAIEEFLK